MAFDSFDLNLLRVFEIVMRERSVTKAAVVLGRTQSAISHSINKLRYMFKDELFTRDGGSMRPTPRALELLVDFADPLAALRAAMGRYQTFDPSETKRNFRIGLTDYHSFLLLPRFIQEFAKQAPEATLNVIPVTAAEVADLIHSRQLDCALIGSFIQDDPSLVKTELGEDRLLCAVWSGSRLAKGPLTLDRYLAASHVQISSDGLSEGLADIALQKRGLSRRVVATFSNYLMMPWVVRGTELLTHCGDNMVQLLEDGSEITLLQPPLPIPNVAVYLISHRLVITDPAIIWLKAFIETNFREWEARKKQMIATSKHVRLN